MLSKLVLPRKARKGRALLQKRKGSSTIIFFFMFQKIPQQVLARDQLHFGIEFVNTTIKIDMLVELSDLLDFLKQSEE
jgi:hypothetical protein